MNFNDFPPYKPLSKGKMQLAASLESAKFRRRHGLFVAQGSKSVADTLDCFRLEWLAASPEWLDSSLPSALKGAENVFSASSEQLRRISSLQSAPQVIAVYELPKQNFSPASPLPDDLYLLLDGVQDPGNLGTIVRTADWFGIKTIFASPDSVDIFNPKALMATMGSIARVRIIYTDLKELVCANRRLPLFGTLLDGKNIYSQNLPDKGLIAFGNEGNGLSEEIRSLVTNPLFIPPFSATSHPESLNVGIASAIVMAEFRRNALINK